MNSIYIRKHLASCPSAEPGDIRFAERGFDDPRPRSWASARPAVLSLFAHTLKSLDAGVDRLFVEMTKDSGRHSYEDLWAKGAFAQLDQLVPHFEIVSTMILAISEKDLCKRLAAWDEARLSIWPEILLPFPPRHVPEDPDEYNDLAKDVDREGLDLLSDLMAESYATLRKLVLRIMSSTVYRNLGLPAGASIGTAWEPLFAGRPAKDHLDATSHNKEALRKYMQHPLLRIATSIVPLLNAMVASKPARKRISNDLNLLDGLVALLIDYSRAFCLTRSVAELVETGLPTDILEVLNLLHHCVMQNKAEWSSHVRQPDRKGKGLPIISLFGHCSADLQGRGEHTLAEAMLAPLVYRIDSALKLQFKTDIRISSRMFSLSALADPEFEKLGGVDAALARLLTSVRKEGAAGQARCDECGTGSETNKLQRCGRCKLAWYCSRLARSRRGRSTRRCASPRLPYEVERELSKNNAGGHHSGGQCSVQFFRPRSLRPGPI